MDNIGIRGVLDAFDNCEQGLAECSAAGRGSYLISGIFVGNMEEFVDEEVPLEFLCPLSKCIMDDPVVAVDGYS